jgi:hypothetical protein
LVQEATTAVRLPAYRVQLEAVVRIRATPCHSAPPQVAIPTATVMAMLATVDTVDMAADTAAGTGTGAVAAGTVAHIVADTVEATVLAIPKVATGLSAHATAPGSMGVGPLEVVSTAVARSVPTAEESIQIRTPCRLAFAISRICW